MTKLRNEDEREDMKKVRPKELADVGCVMILETNYFYSWTSNLHIYFNENKTKCDDR